MTRTRPPCCFTEWRDEYHSALFALAMSIQLSTNEHSQVIIIDRCIWRLLHRIRRIQTRLDVEHEVMDKTWCAALLQCLYDGDAA